MNPNKRSARHISLLLTSLLAGAGILGAADQATVQSQNDELARLRQALAAQQIQLQSLQQAIEQLQQTLNKSAATPSPASAASKAAAPAKNPCEAGPDAQTPAFFRLGGVCIVPVGFMDLTGFWRDKNAASGIGTNFGSIPYNNTTAGRLSEFRFSPQNSRIGFRIDGNWNGTHFIGYNEFDFLGVSGGNNLGVTNGAFVPRVRLYWVDVRKGKFEMLAGQSWSMLTPNRKGISALPGDLFYTQVLDVNYMSGLTWTRQPGVRFLYHPTSKVTAGISFENPDQYIGGSGGSPVITLPAALASAGGGQFDNTTNVLNTPNLHPDIIAKIAFDPNSKIHFEVAGIERTFKLFNPNTAQYFTKAGGGALVGLNVELMKNFRLITTNFWSDGGGRYLFGEAPDVIIRADGSISPVHAGGTVDGFEATVKGNTLLYGYYGGTYIGRNTAFDANGTTRVGYGFTGSANSNNRTQQEVTFGFNQTIWRNPRYGAINYMMQYQYQLRNPWFVAPGAPKGTHTNAIYMNIRYTLPGGIPNF